jgi:hypothetical protein
MCIKPAELFAFENNVEPMICFKRFPLFWEQRELELALEFLKTRILPHRLQWEDYKFNPNEIVGFGNKIEELDDEAVSTTKSKVSKGGSGAKKILVEGENASEVASPAMGVEAVGGSNLVAAEEVITVAVAEDIEAMNVEDEENADAMNVER